MDASDSDSGESAAPRDTQRNTNWRHRQNALDPEHLYQMQYLRTLAECFLSGARDGLLRLYCLNVLRVYYNRHGRGDLVSSVRRSIAKTMSLTIVMTSLCFLYICDFEEMLYYFPSELPSPGPHPPPTNRSIDCFDEEYCRFLFRFKKSELRSLLNYWRVPNLLRVVESGRYAYFVTGEEAMLIYINRLMHGNRFRCMMAVFGGDGVRRYGFIIRSFVDHLYDNFYHKISGNSLAMYVEHVDTFRHAIWSALMDGIEIELDDESGNVRTRVLDIVFALFRIFGFIDDTGIPTCRPGVEPTMVQQWMHDIQRAYYRYLFVLFVFILKLFPNIALSSKTAGTSVRMASKPKS